MKKEFRIGDKIHVEYEIYDIRDGTVYGYCPGSTTRTGVCLISTALNIVKHIPAPYVPQIKDLVKKRLLVNSPIARICGINGEYAWCRWTTNKQYFTILASDLIFYSRED